MKDKEVIFFDLDGVVFNVFRRNYQVYKEILKKYGKSPLAFKEYIDLKRKKISFQEILKKKRADDILEQFEKEWNNLIEKPHYLKLDRITQKKKEVLLALKRTYPLILITLRKNKKALYEQLKKKKIAKIFDKVLVASGRSKNPKWKIKSKLLKKYGKFSKNSIIVGDTETDILMGKHLVIKTIAVSSGMRNRKFLKKYKPDILIKDFSEIKNIINQ